MTDFVQRIKDLPQQHLVLLAAQLQERLEEATAAGRTDEAVAVVGVACRFPGGVDDPESYWDLLVEGRDAITEVPPDRFDVDAFYDADWQRQGRMASRWGGFLDRIDHFDARRFGISPREAVTMDPQQRLLLEVSHQALERAGIAPRSLHGSRTGVFCGLSSIDYLQVQIRRGMDAIDGYQASGSAPSVASGRLAYTLGLNGPALTVDTACSSSLVAVHLAVQSLRRGECDTAIAAGVNVMLSPVTTIALSKSQMMASDGRCKTFSAEADGFVRGEGCGVLVLKPLSAALEARDQVVGVIRGSAINQDGRSNGLTAPNGPAQEAVLAAALADAGVAPADIGYVEAHGTGTRLGDPIEVQALAAVLGAREERLLLGSVKTNIGHLESAAGIAGLIKALLVLEHGQVPPHLHLDEPSPVIPWGSIPIDVPTSMTPWPAGRPRLAGVSSFGFSGTNAHVVLEGAPTPEPDEPGRPRAEVVVLSAQSAEALREAEEALASHLAVRRSAPLAPVSAALALGRDAMAHRSAFVASSSAELVDALAAVPGGSAAVANGHVTESRPPRPVWLFTGQGSQHPGMGRELYAAEPVFAAVLDRCDEALRTRFGIELLEVMFADDDPRLHQTGHTQPAIFSLQVALAALWRSWGVDPAAVVGHSVGELAAAHVAGLFDLDDGLVLAASRGRLMQSLPAGGRMVALPVSPGELEAAIRGREAFVSLAAVNGPREVVLSGRADHVEAVVAGLGEQLGAAGGRDLEVSHAFHSPSMDPILDPFTEVASTVTFRDPDVSIVSNLFGEVAGRDRLGDPTYWRRHAREAVRFGPSIASLVDGGHRLFLEIGPRPTLSAMAARAVDDPDVRFVHSLRPGREEGREIGAGLAALWVAGVDVDWRGRFGPTPPRRAVLPTSPLQRERYWPDDARPWGQDAPVPPADGLDGLVHEVVWEPAARSGSAAAGPGGWMGAPSDAGRAVDEVAEAVAVANGVDAYDRFVPRLDELCAAHVVTGFRRLGVELREGERFSTDVLVERLGARDHRRLVGRMAEMLEEDGWLERDGDDWVVRRQGEPDPDALHAAIAAGFPQFSAELELLQRCGVAMADVIRGSVDVLQVLFPGGSSAQMEAIYRDMPMARTFNELLARAVDELVVDHPEGRPLRVVEVGGGSGGTTDSVRAALTGHQLDYLFTDVSPAFTRRARERYAGSPEMRFATFDASLDPATQGLEVGAADLVVAANVVHATPDLRATLANLRALLAPGGCLVLLEATTRERFSDLTVGFTPGWWSFEDLDLRPDHALLTREGWERVLAESGFDATVAVPTVSGRSRVEALRREAVVVATRPLDDAGAGSSPAVPRRWVLVGEGSLADVVGSGLEAAGDAVVRVEGQGPDPVREALAAAGPGIEGVVVAQPPLAVDLESVDDGELRAAMGDAADVVLGAVQGVLAGPPVPLWLVTGSAQPVAGSPLRDPAGASLWGVGHVVALEHPELECRRVDVDPSAIATGELVDELRHADPVERQVAWRGDRRFVRRLARAGLARRDPVVLDGDASYVVSGGLRGLGPLVADWLVRRGARHLVLFGRSAPDPAVAAEVARWRDLGVEVAVEQADASSDADVRRVLGVAGSMGPIRGVVHGAGLLDDAALVRQDRARFVDVYGPKVFGTASLVRHLDGAALDFLVLFGSGAGVGGSAGQANHAAASAVLDAVAHRLAERSVRVCCIDWGAWTGVGAAADRGIDTAPGAFSPEEGLAVLDRVVAGLVAGSGPAQVFVHAADWSDVTSRIDDPSVLALYRDLIGPDVTARRAAPTGAPAPVASRALLEQLAPLPERRRRMVLREQVRAMAAAVLDVGDADRIEVGQPLHDLGLDSLMAVELRNSLRDATGADLPATLLFEQPTVVALVDHLLDEHLVFEDDAAPPDPGERPDPATAGAEVPTGAAPVDDVAAALAARLDRLSGGGR